LSLFLNGPALLGLVLFLIGAFSASGRLRFGHWAGLRLPSTLKSETAWVAGHRAASPWLMIGGLAGIVAGHYVSGAYAGRYGGWRQAVVLAEALFVLAAIFFAHHAARRADPPDGSRPPKR
jgi:hypothetical protein